MTIQSGRYIRAHSYPVGIDCPSCQMTVLGLWHDVGPDKQKFCDECHTAWEKSLAPRGFEPTPR